jgi:hypothetical protein
MNTKEYRKFGLIMAAMVAVFFGGLLPWIFSWSYSYIPWLISASLLLSALVFPKALLIIYKPWMLLGNVLGYINTRIILGIIFFGLFVPIALILKIMHKDAMNRKLQIEQTSSYWQAKNAQDKEHMENIY